MLGVVLAIALGGVAYFGLFASVEAERGRTGAYRLVYKDLTGPYDQVAATMDELYFELLDQGVETRRGFGLYFDNPEEVPAAELRSRVGCVVEPEAWAALDSVRDQFQVMDYPDVEAVVARFPYRGSASIMFGAMKVYPKLAQALGTRPAGGPALEVYDLDLRSIFYAMPLEDVGLVPPARP